ncbi:MAG: hypothetical protein WCS82_08135 [Candidatus Riflebacteria bacterium]
MKIIKLAVALMFCLYFVSAGQAAETDRDVLKKVSRIERYIYGEEMKSPIQERLRQIEEDLFGRSTGRANEDKASYLHDFIFRGTSQNISLDMKLSYLEWKVFNKTGAGNLEARLADLDRVVFGHVSMEPMAFRLEQLVHLSIEDGLITMHSVIIPEGTVIKLKTKKEVSSRTSQKGDIVPVVMAHDLFINNNVLVMTTDGIVSAEVKNVRRSGRFGRTGYINLDLRNVETMDSTLLPVSIEDMGEKYDKKKISMAAGASTLGYIVLGPIGLAGGAFIKGGEIEIPEGTEITVRTTEARRVTGVFAPNS